MNNRRLSDFLLSVNRKLLFIDAGAQKTFPVHLTPTAQRPRVSRRRHDVQREGGIDATSGVVSDVLRGGGLPLWPSELSAGAGEHRPLPLPFRRQRRPFSRRPPHRLHRSDARSVRPSLRPTLAPRSRHAEILAS